MPQISSEQSDPVLILDRERAATLARWQLADEAAEAIERSFPESIRRPRVVAAQLAIADELFAAAEAIELHMAETVPTTLAGIRALADFSTEGLQHVDERDARMIDRIIDALEAMPTSPTKVILQALAEHAAEHYEDEDKFTASSMMLKAIVVAIDAITGTASPVIEEDVA
jgi:hypothetical protein